MKSTTYAVILKVLKIIYKELFVGTCVMVRKVFVPMKF